MTTRPEQLSSSLPRLSLEKIKATIMTHETFQLNFAWSRLTKVINDASCSYANGKRNLRFLWTASLSVSKKWSAVSNKQKRNFLREKNVAKLFSWLSLPYFSSSLDTGAKLMTHQGPPSSHTSSLLKFGQACTAAIMTTSNGQTSNESATFPSTQMPVCE